MTSSPPTRFCAWAACIALGLGLASAASAQPFVYRVAAVNNGPAIGVPGASYRQFWTVSIGGAGRVVFRASLDGVPDTHGVFVAAQEASRLIAARGQEVPGATGESYTSLFSAIAAPRGGAFVASTTGEVLVAGQLERAERVYVDDAGEVAAIVGNGDPAPATGGGVFRLFDGLATNASGSVAISAEAADAAVDRDDGLWLWTGNGIHPVAVSDDPAPGTGGGSFWYISGFDLNDSDEIVLHAPLKQGTVEEGLFLVAADGTVSTVALTGDPAPGTDGGVFETFNFSSPVVNEAGVVGFRARIANGSSSAGLFSAEDGVVTVRALVGDPAPGTAGGTLMGISRKIGIDDAGRLYFRSTISGGTSSDGIFAGSEGGISPVVLLGDPAPVEVGGVFAGFDEYLLSVNGAGDVAFEAKIFQGSVSGGLFVAERPGTVAVPASSRPALAVTALLIACAGFAVQRRLPRLPRAR